MEEAIDLFSEEISVVHIEDYDVRDRRLISMSAGLGQMNYDALIRFMKYRKTFIHATLEDTRPENNVQCKDFIQKLYDEAQA